MSVFENDELIDGLLHAACEGYDISDPSIVVDIDEEDDYIAGYDDGEWMDGDHDSAMRDAGFGTDEDYGYYGDYDGDFGYDDF